MGSSVCTRVIQSDLTHGKQALSYRGLAYVFKHDNDKALQDFNLYLQYYPDDAGTLINRARAEAEKDENDSAIQDLNQALHLNTSDANNNAALAGFALPYMAKGDFKSAIEALNQVIQKMPNVAGLFYERGIAKIYDGEIQSAISDLEKASALDTSNLYKIIWLHLARLKAGQKDDGDLQINSTKFSSDEWPEPIVALYSGKSTVEEVFVKTKNADSLKQQEQICEAHFYVGIFYEQKGKKDQAKKEFEFTDKKCPKYLIEQELSQTQLKLLSQ